MSLGNYKNITEIEQMKKISGMKNKIIIVKFGAKWCEPCKFIEPWFKSISKSHPDVIFGTIDHNDKLKNVFNAYRIKVFPTFIGLHNNKYQILCNGANKKNLKILIEKYVNTHKYR